MLVAGGTSRAGAAPPPQPGVLVVSPQGPYTSIQAALAAAQPGATIEVQRGVYAGPVTVEKTVTLEGVGWPVIDGGGQGTVVTLAAPNIVFRGFEVRGSGVEPDRDHSGITVTAPHVTVEGNRLVEVLFGIFVAQAESAIIRGNDVTGIAAFDEGRKGDGLRLWYSPKSLIEGNIIHETRDVVIWYSSEVVVRDNLVQGGRYGVHLMYCNQVNIERNRLLNNSVGIYSMYSAGSQIRENLVRGQRGPSGHALGFKDADNIEVTNNVLVDNRVGVFLDGTPYTPQGYSRFVDNTLAFNDVGVILQPAVHGNRFERNVFWENVEQVAGQGGGALGRNEWGGNYWSDYTGFDANGDGVGDTAYRAERFFDNLMDREPRLRALLYSPAAQAIEFAAATFPIVRPQPKLTDQTPRVQPPALPASVQALPREVGGMRLVALALLVLGLVSGGAAFVGGNVRKKGKVIMDVQPAVAAADPGVAIQVTRLTKRYGGTAAIDDVSFTVRQGEALALWGSNGAGKTTLLKAILGLVECQGEIWVQGLSTRLAGKAVRRHIGYVPQEMAFYDLSVQATVEFYARLKHAPAETIPTLLKRMGLTEHARKPVAALSGGLKQRLALAIALLADPPILLLDEPTANLDVAARRDYLTLLAGLHHEGKTLIFASHRLDEVEILADRVLVLNQGQAVSELTPEALRQQVAAEVKLTLWLSEAHRLNALACLQQSGLAVSMNGRGTVIVQVPADQKMKPLALLSDKQLEVLDFEVE